MNIEPTRLRRALRLLRELELQMERWKWSGTGLSILREVLVLLEEEVAE